MRLFGTTFADPDDDDGRESIYDSFDSLTGSTADRLRHVANRITCRWLLRLDMPRVLAIEELSCENPMHEREFSDLLKIGNTVARVAEIDGHVCGFSVYSLGKRSISLLNLAVDPDFRRNGVGRKLIGKLVEALSANRRHKIDVRVRERNLAGLLFLKACGFLATGTDREWYTDTQEDAILMSLDMNHNGSTFV